jgi:hypothetical protein
VSVVDRELVGIKKRTISLRLLERALVGLSWCHTVSDGFFHCLSHPGCDED